MRYFWAKSCSLGRLCRAAWALRERCRGGLFLAGIIVACGASSPPIADAGVVIEVNFVSGLTASQQAHFSVAASYWQSLIVDYSVGFNPLLAANFNQGRIAISASGEAIDGVGGVLGSAGPEAGVGTNGLLYTATGVMQFDTADLAALESSNRLLSVIMHEMAHVLGFGILWDPAFSYNILGYQDIYNEASFAYVGTNALNEWKTEFGQTAATFIPIESAGGSGTAHGHWDEFTGGAVLTGITDSLGRDMRNELMTGWLNAPSFLSRMSVAQFADIGYEVDFSNLAFINANLNEAVTVPEPTSLVVLTTAALFGYRQKRNRSQRGTR